MVTSRPYTGRHDLEKLLTFLAQARSSVDHAHYLHAGDLLWQMFHMQAAFNPSEIVQLWQDGPGNVIGFVLLYPAFGFFDLQGRRSPQRQ